MYSERGSVELILMLVFILSLQLSLWILTRQMSLQVLDAYGVMDPIEADETLEFKDFDALGQTLPAPAPLIDFGADDTHGKDAQALCAIVSRFGCANASRSFRCN